METFFLIGDKVIILLVNLIGKGKGNERESQEERNIDVKR